MQKRLGEYSIHLVFGILILLSIILYKERLFVDASYYFFKAINSGSFHVEHGRLVLAISQIGPLLASFLGLPLKFVMLIASVGNELFYYSVFLLTYYGLKDRIAGIAVLAIHLIGQTWLFYVPMAEIYYGAALMVPFMVILKSNRYKDQKYLLLLFLLQWLIMTSHPLNFSLIAFVLIADFLENKWNSKIYVQIALLALLGLIVQLTAADAYEQDKLSVLSSPVNLNNLLDGTYLKELIIYLLSYYYELVLILIATIIISFKNGKKLSLVILFFFLGAVVLIANYRGIANTNTWYTEIMYAPLVSLVVLFFSFYNLNKQNEKTFVNFISVIILILLPRLAMIWNGGEDLRNRMTQIEYLTDQLQDKGGSKYLIEEENYSRDYSLMTWSNPLDVLMNSALDGAENTISLCTVGEFKFEKNASKLNDSNFIFRRFEVHPNHFLNDSYFELNKEKYTALNTSKEVDDIGRLDSTLTVHLIEEFKSAKAKDSAYVWVKIFNGSGISIPSLPREKIYLSYLWYKDNSLVEGATFKTPLMIDVEGDFIQDIKLAFPKSKGEYQVEIALYLNGKRIGERGKRYKASIED